MQHLVLASWLLVLVASTSATAQIGPGIRPLTKESFESAVAAADDCNPTIPCDAENRVEVLGIGGPAGPVRFLVVVETPFTRVMNKVAEAQRKLRNPPAMSAAWANQQQVVLLVDPGHTPIKIEDAAIKRGDKLIRAIRGKVTPTVLVNRLGARIPSTVGRFVFPLDAFAATDSIFVIIVTDRLTAQESVLKEQLAKMR